MKLAVRQLRNRRVNFATIHGNDPILRAVVAGKGELRILSVTVLMSFGEEDMIPMLGAMVRIEDLVFNRPRSALKLGCDEVVSWGMEASRLRDDLGENLLTVTPASVPVPMWRSP